MNTELAVSNEEIVERFMASLRSDPDLAAIAMVAQPYLVMMRDRSTLVAVMDRAAELWAKARGGRFVVEDPT